MSENEKGMEKMLGILKKFLEERGLELNVEKSKMMECRKGEGRGRGGRFDWKGQEIESMNVFNYPRITICRNVGNGQHLVKVQKEEFYLHELHSQE